MGFPVGCSDFVLPGMLLRVLVLLYYVHRFFLWVFWAVGLGDLLDFDMICPETHGDGQQQRDRQQSRYQFRQFQSVPATLIQEALPALRYEELMAEEHGRRVGGSCAVCLHELQAAEEVRRLSNCRHVFHRSCLDQWLEHDQRTCPLCRAPLVPEEAVQDGAFGGREMQAYADGTQDAYYADGTQDAYYVDDLSYSSSLFPYPYLESTFPLLITQSPTLILDAHQLLSSSSFGS